MFLVFGGLLYRWRIPILVVWALVAFAAAVIAPRVFQVLDPGGFTSSSLEAFQADQRLADKFSYDPSTLYVVYQDPNGRVQASDPRFLADVRTGLAEISSLPDVAAVTEPDQSPRQVAPDGQAAYATIALRSTTRDFRSLLPELEQAIQPTELQTTLTGEPVFYQDIYDVTERDLRRAEEISFPFAAAALFIVFGSLVAAAVPGVVGGTAVAVTLAAMVLLSHFVPLSIFALNLTTMLGLGLGIDYSLFIVSRFREELARGRTVEEAVAGSIATAGRAVLFSGITVGVGMLGMLLFEFNALRSLGIAGALVVVVSVLAALTLLPAALGVLGTRIDALALKRLLHVQRDTDPTGGSGFWARLARLVMAHPIAILVPVLVALLTLGLPFLQVQMGAPDASILPSDVQSRRGFDLLNEHWGQGELAPILVVFSTNDGSSPLTPDRIGALYDYMQQIQADPNVQRVSSIVTIDPRLNKAQYQLLEGSPRLDEISDVYALTAIEASVRDDTVVAQVTSRTSQTDPHSKDIVRAIRATPPPAGFSVIVGGATAGVVDYADHLYARFPAAAAFVVVAIYAVLLFTFRSIVIPLKAILMNFLSILASYGALVVIFQDGALSSQLGFRPLGFVEASLPIVMFCVLFGLSMDYEVFLLSRVKEAYDSGMGNAASVARGLERSGRIITSAAAIVVLVSLSFVAADIVLIKALGLGTAIAVFLDATVVRALLVPATMRLLGDWNWWSPRWARRIFALRGAHAG